MITPSYCSVVIAPLSFRGVSWGPFRINLGTTIEDIFAITVSKPKKKLRSFTSLRLMTTISFSNMRDTYKSNTLEPSISNKKIQNIEISVNLRTE